MPKLKKNAKAPSPSSWLREGSRGDADRHVTVQTTLAFMMRVYLQISVTAIDHAPYLPRKSSNASVFPALTSGGSCRTPFPTNILQKLLVTKRHGATASQLFKDLKNLCFSNSKARANGCRAGDRGSTDGSPFLQNLWMLTEAHMFSRLASITLKRASKKLNLELILKSSGPQADWNPGLNLGSTETVVIVRFGNLGLRV